MQTWFIFDRGKIVWKKKKRSSSPLARYTVRRLDGRAICTWNVEVSLIFMTGGGGVGSPNRIKTENRPLIYICFVISFDIITRRAFFHNSFLRGFFSSIVYCFCSAWQPFKATALCDSFFSSSLSYFSHSFLWLKMALCVCALACAPPRTYTNSAGSGLPFHPDESSSH